MRRIAAGVIGGYLLVLVLSGLAAAVTMGDTPFPQDADVWLLRTLVMSGMLVVVGAVVLAAVWLLDFACEKDQ